MKDPTKKVVVGPDMLLSNYRAMVREVEQRTNFYHEPYYEQALRALSQQEIDELQRLTDSCCEMMRNFVRQIKEGLCAPAREVCGVGEGQEVSVPTGDHSAPSQAPARVQCEGQKGA